MSRIIFIAGMSRAGSMWTYNVTRRLLKASGYNPLPETIPADDQAAIRDTVKTDPGPKGVFCFKTHRVIQPISPQMKIICPYRDVRDAMYSYMKFMKCPFDRALLAAQGMMENTDYYLQNRAKNIFPLRYDEILNNPVKTICNVAAFINLTVPDTVINEIADTLSKEKMEKYLKGLDKLKANEEGKLRPNAEASRFLTLPRLDGSYRVYDNSTGFQSNHITTGKDGEWKIHLKPEQQNKLMELTVPWLEKYGFPI